MAEVTSFPLSTTPIATILASLNFALYKATSATSLAVGTGSKVFTTQSGKDFAVGDFVLATSDADEANYMLGQITAYSGTSLTINVPASNYIGGSGTHADWTLRLSGPPGATGVTGAAAWSAPAAWLTATAYVATAPASVVTQGGETYVCLVAHTSGVFATDLAASKWIKVAAKGADGAVSITGTPSANQFATWASATSVQGVSITGLVKGNGASAPTAATAGTDYVAPATATSFTAHQGFSLQTLTDAANIDWAANTAQKAKVTLGGNRTMNAVTGAVEGYTYFLWVIQDATGSRTITWTTSGAGSFDFGSTGAPTLTTTASKADLLTFEAISIGGTLKLRYAGIAKAFT